MFGSIPKVKSSVGHNFGYVDESAKSWVIHVWVKACCDLMSKLIIELFHLRFASFKFPGLPFKTSVGFCAASAYEFIRLVFLDNAFYLLWLANSAHLAKLEVLQDTKSVVLTHVQIAPRQLKLALWP